MAPPWTASTASLSYSDLGCGSPDLALVPRVHLTARLALELLAELVEVGQGADHPVVGRGVRVLLHLQLCRFLRERRAPDLGEGHEEELAVGEVQSGKHRRLGKGAGSVQIGVICCFQAAVVGDVFSQGLVAVDALIVYFVLIWKTCAG